MSAWGGLIGAGVGTLGGLIKHNQDLGQYNRDKDVASVTTRFSPWTGMQGQMPRAPGSAFGSALQGAVGGGLTGMQFGGGAAQANPMQGAEQVGVDSSLSPAAQGPGAGLFAGGYDQSPWARMNPTLYG